MIRLLIASAVLALASWPAGAATCAGNPDALGTARVLAVHPTLYPRVGRKHFPQTLPLARKEVVLTFDDGPSPATTEWVLESLSQECVKATFFLLGRNAAAHPAIARRIAARGHTIGTHTFSHPLLSHMSQAAAEGEINRGIEAVEAAIQNPGGARPFFRFPGFASSPALLKRLEERGIVVFGADVWASDWNPMRPEDQLRLLMRRIDAAGGGIVLLHDTQPQTAKMLPGLLTALKRGGYSIVHVVPSSPQSQRTERSTAPRLPPRG